MEHEKFYRSKSSFCIFCYGGSFKIARLISSTLNDVKLSVFADNWHSRANANLLLYIAYGHAAHIFNEKSEYSDKLEFLWKICFLTDLFQSNLVWCLSLCL